MHPLRDSDEGMFMPEGRGDDTSEHAGLVQKVAELDRSGDEQPKFKISYIRLVSYDGGIYVFLLGIYFTADGLV